MARLLSLSAEVGVSEAKPNVSAESVGEARCGSLLSPQPLRSNLTNGQYFNEEKTISFNGC
jgi:hypothetical protein